MTVVKDLSGNRISSLANIEREVSDSTVPLIENNYFTANAITFSKV